MFETPNKPIETTITFAGDNYRLRNETFEKIKPALVHWTAAHVHVHIHLPIHYLGMNFEEVIELHTLNSSVQAPASKSTISFDPQIDRAPR